MQVLKEEVRRRILEAAMEEFFHKGFEKASMRRIAARSDITPGNIYRYFKSKEEIFRDIVQPAYVMVVNLIQRDRSHKSKDDFAKTIEDFLDICKDYGEQLSILIGSGKGTPYANVKSDVVKMVEKKVKDDLPREILALMEPLERDFMIHIHAHNMVEGVVLILRQYPVKKDRTEVLKKYLLMEVHKWNYMISALEGGEHR